MNDRNTFDRGDESRRRHSQSRDAVPAGAKSFPCKTVAVGTYPTGSLKYYMVRRIAFDGAETQGGALTERDVGHPFPAASLGAAPPLGTRVVVTRCGSRWVFRY